MSGLQNRLNRQDPSRLRIRLIVAGCIVSLAFALLGGRFWYLQVVKGPELRERSENNRIRVREIKPLRGLILDSRGTILVDNSASFDIGIIPNEARNVDAVVDTLKRLYDEQELSYAGVPDFQPGRRLFTPVSLERNVGWDKLALVEAHSAALPGVVIDVVPVRNYTMGPSMAHVLGYVGEISPEELRGPSRRDYRPGSIIGKSGIERMMDRYLKGESGGEQIEVNVVGRTLNVLARVEAMPGLNVVTTLDAGLQKLCWDVLEDHAGAVIVMDPRDGSIRAMVSKPSFDPNLFNRGITVRDWDAFRGDTRAPFKNRAIAAHYPPASLFKLIVAAAALDRGLITGDETISCRGSLVVGDRTFRCWKREGGHGALNLHQAIVQSCDVYFYTLGLQLGIDVIAEYARAFGLGELTALDILGEKEGLVPSRDWKHRRFGESWQQGETVSVSIGQGFLNATPLQLVRAFSALTNGGILYKPRILDRLETPRGEVVDVFHPLEVARLPLSPEHRERLKKALWGAVNEQRGTGGAAGRSERDVCGKTGTAQVISMPDDDDEVKTMKTPQMHRDHALFVCSVPCGDPRVTVIIVVEHAGHGGSVAAPMARKIVDWYMEHRSEPGSEGETLTVRGAGHGHEN
ncbi:MAG: penicillin-binding protein 2 [Syntrophales bacterium]|jgi:penicillin-binding protein 2|nr:penicillin-binding protein 2 [Syntrophales bacterium]MCK9528125.1 penicillin-binding protein 2 [Syntrophales bacterium]MDX9921094.1 penicillin-binding protein 2 [Syntrophales bacterium]